jgi:N6-adenosine-specific RNA methylase IME4
MASKTNKNPPLMRYDAATKALAEAVAIDEVKDIRDKAVEMAVYAKQAKDGTLIEHATAIRIRAERRAGEMLYQMGERGERETKGGDRKSKSNGATLILPKLSDLGVTRSQSSNWQRLAAMQPAAFEQRVERVTRKAVNALDGAGRRTRHEIRAEDEERVRGLVPLLGTTFLTLVIDSPWESDWLSESAGQTPYATMSIEELFALPVAQWAAEECHLYFWTLNNFMPVACEAVKHFGFQHRTIITWKKPRWGRGDYFRNQTEHVIFATKGDLHTRSDSIPTYFEAPMGEHSEKPEQFYDVVRKASYLPAGEAFQRKPREGFINLFGAPRSSSTDESATEQRANV